ncbi:MAG: tripartite tricarboxylate transporter substrate-binding protein [Burkholderiales bacterium]
MGAARTLACALTLAAFGANANAQAQAQAWPTKPIRIVTAGVGGGNDWLSRVIAQGIAGPLGQQLVVDNRGGGVIPGEVVSRTAPDGYTLLVMAGSLWVGQLMRKTPYEVQRDFAPITLADRAPNVLVVHPSLPLKSVQDLVALARAKPSLLNYSSAGTASSSHLSGELFKALARVNMVNIQYKNNSQEMVDLLAGNVQLAFGTASVVSPYVKTGRLRALAVTSAKPSPLAPGLPAIAQAGLPGYQAEALHAVFAPARTPDAIVRRLNAEIVKLLHAPSTKEQFFAAGVEAVGSTPEELAATVTSEIARWGSVIRQAGIRAE